MSDPVIGHVSFHDHVLWAGMMPQRHWHSSVERMWPRILGANMAVGAALCRAHENGYVDGYHSANEERDWPDLNDDRRRYSDWQPGCGWSAP